MNTQKGFTLVEMIIAMAVTLVLVGITTSIYLVQAKNVTNSLAFSTMQRGYDLFNEEFGSDVRYANRILDSSEVFNPIKTGFGDGTTTSVVVTYNQNGSIANRYSFKNDTILHNGAPFNIGGEILTVDSDSSFFILSNFRDRIIVELKITFEDDLISVELPKRDLVFKCRN